MLDGMRARLSWRRVLQAALTATLCASLATMIDCSGIGKEGDRCNPNRSSDECNSGLACTTNSCGLSVCCPAKIDKSSAPECQSEQPDCPTDGGETGDAPGDTPGDAADSGG